MELRELFEGGLTFLESLVRHPILTISAVAVTGATLYGVANYDRYATPSRAATLYSKVLANPKEFNYEESTGFLESKAKKGKIESFGNPKRIELETGEDSSLLVNFLIREKSTYSHLIIDNEPLGSPDKIATRERNTKREGFEQYGKKDFKPLSEEQRETLQDAYIRLIKATNKEIK